jgi:hypothetical protein
MANYIHLKWWNTCDIKNVTYQGSYRNEAYFETELLAPSYVDEEEGFNNGEGVFIKTFEILKKRYKFQINAPEYVADALKFIRLHDNIQLSIIDSTASIVLFQTAIRNVNVNVTYDPAFLDCFATIDFTFEQDDQVVITGCCN